MVSINNVFTGSTLKAEDLNGREYTLVIASYEIKQFDDGSRKIVLSFQGADKALICNKTNANRIASLYGDEMDNWIGRKITLYPDMVDFQGKLVPAIRVKVGMITPVQQAPEPMNNGLPDPGATLPDAGAPLDIDDEISFAPERRV